MISLFINIYIKFFFILTPFFLLSTFLSLTRDKTIGEKKKIAVKVTVAIVIVSTILLFTGNYIFYVFGITLNSFRIGTGVLLFLSSVLLVQGNVKNEGEKSDEDISVVPLAIPVAVGPATTGALLVMGVELKSFTDKIVGFTGLAAAIFSTGVLLYLSGSVERVLKKQGLVILSKITGLVIAALAAQMIMTGIKDFFSIGMK